MNTRETKRQAQLAFEIKLNRHSLLHPLMINVNADRCVLDSQTFRPLWVWDLKSQAIFLLESGNIWCFWRWSMWTTIIRVERIIWVDFCTPRLMLVIQAPAHNQLAITRHQISSTEWIMPTHRYSTASESLSSLFYSILLAATVGLTFVRVLTVCDTMLFLQQPDCVRYKKHLNDAFSCAGCELALLKHHSFHM